jgi:Tol biopolymer transport system component
LIVAADSNGDVNRRLWIAAQGKRAELLFPTLDDYRSVTLSGDGRRLAAINLTRAVALKIAVPSEQWAVKPLTADRGDPGVYGAAWKSNGEIIYVESGAEGRRLWSMHADGTGATQLTRVGRDRAGDVYPRGCHDGSIVFTSFRPTPSVVVRRQDGSETTVGTGFFPDCSDEGRIIFTTYGSQNLAHSIVDRNGQAVPTHCLDASLLHPTFSPDGTTVAGFTLDLKANHWTMTTCDLSTGKVRTLWHTSLRDSRFPWIRWRPDGRSLTYLSPRDGALEVWMIPLDGKPTREGFVDGEAAFALDWSRDGTKLLYAAGKTRSDVLMYEVPMK